jgi:hypothetical protein
MNTRLQSLFFALAFASCGDAPPIPPPGGTPLNVVPASAQTTSLTHVTSWQLFFNGAATGPETLLVYGVDHELNGVAEMQLRMDGPQTARVLEFTVMKNGVWSERVIIDLGQQLAGFDTKDLALTQTLWTQLQSDLQSYLQSGAPLGTQSAGVPYSICDGCADENATAALTCAGGVIGIIGTGLGILAVGPACTVGAVFTLGTSCVVAIGGTGVAASGGAASSGLCVISEKAMHDCWNATSGSVICDSTKGLVAEKTTCSGNQVVPTGNCICDQGLVPAKYDSNGFANQVSSGAFDTCLPLCPMCSCFYQKSGTVNLCVQPYSTLINGMCQPGSPTDAVARPETNSCCPNPLATHPVAACAYGPAGKPPFPWY